MLNLCSYVLVLVEDVQTDLSAGTVERSWAYRRVYRAVDPTLDRTPEPGSFVFVWFERESPLFFLL